MICNESNGENPKMKSDEDNIGMKIYNSEQIENLWRMPVLEECKSR